MANSFVLILDTTPPIIELTLIHSSSENATIDITINSNEQLLNQQDFYLLDSMGTRFDCALSLNENEKIFSGQVNLIGLASGIATFFYSVKDVVENVTSAEQTLIFGVTPKIIFSTKPRNTNFVSKPRNTNFISKI